MTGLTCHAPLLYIICILPWLRPLIMSARTPSPVSPPTELASRARFHFRGQLRPTLRLALPLVLAELGWMSMAIVDTMMVGRLPDSAAAIGAVSVSSNLFHVLVFFGEGLLIGLVAPVPPR